MSKQDVIERYSNGKLRSFVRKKESVSGLPGTEAAVVVDVSAFSPIVFSLR